MSNVHTVLTSLHSLNVLHCPQISYAGVVPLLLGTNASSSIVSVLIYVYMYLALNDVTDFKCESDKLRPQLYRDEERYYKADPDDESDEDEEEDEEDDEFI